MWLFVSADNLLLVHRLVDLFVKQALERNRDFTDAGWTWIATPMYQSRDKKVENGQSKGSGNMTTDTRVLVKAGEQA